jgi:hypothetical protein
MVPRRRTNLETVLVFVMLSLLLAGSSSPADGRAAVRPRAAVSQAHAEWLRDIRSSAKTGDRAARFPSPSRTVLLRRLRNAAQSYGFRIAKVQMLHPLQRAPVITIRSDRMRAIARATPSIVALFDARRPTRSNPSGYAYEAYFLVAERRDGIPYLATFNHWRAPHVGGGQWAAAEDLYPFPHG